MENRKEILRDPFRALMYAVPCGKAVTALCALVCAVFFVVVMRITDAAGMDGPAVIALCGAAGLAILLWGMAPALTKEKQPLLVWLWPVLLCVLAVAAHLFRQEAADFAVAYACRTDDQRCAAFQPARQPGHERHAVSHGLAYALFACAVHIHRAKLCIADGFKSRVHAQHFRLGAAAVPAAEIAFTHG